MKIKKLLAIVVDENDVESEMDLSEISPLCDSFSYSKVRQVRPPMPGVAQTSDVLFGIKVELAVGYDLEENTEEGK